MQDGDERTSLLALCTGYCHSSKKGLAKRLNIAGAGYVCFLSTQQASSVETSELTLST
jgi:hypothetical protein